MILVDSSAWIEFLRGTGTTTCNAVDEFLDGEIAICDPVGMEIFAGARDERHLSQLRRLLARATMIHVEPIDYEAAAALYRTCRRSGETPRRLVDCLIGAVAIRAGASVLHADVDFEVLWRHASLQTHPASLR